MADTSKFEKIIKLAKWYQKMGLKNKRKAYERARQEIKNRSNT